MLHPSSLRFVSAAACAALALLAGTASAQVYRSVGPDGKVIYSDKPPAANTREAAPAAASGAPASGGLPYQLNQTAQRYPVTLYTGSACAPCNSGRNLLVQRGVPFTEKTIESNNDIEALQRRAGDTNLPVLTIGGQRLSGFSDAEWTQYLDAAGYPKTSQLPASYRRPAATPLAPASASRAPAATAPATEASAPAAPAAPSVAPARDASNPAGIRF